MPPEQLRQELLKKPVWQICMVMQQSLQRLWDHGGSKMSPSRYETPEQRYEAVLESVRNLEVLLPEYEERAREIYAKIPWPTTFEPIPKFEKLFGLKCSRCGGTGIAGFFTGIRCPDC